MFAQPTGVGGQLKLSLEPERRIFSVGDLNSALQRLLETDFRNIFVAGEISGCRIAASGHYYFSLKDEHSQIKCALFKGTARFSRFKPQDGLTVIARGNLEIFEARGEYQLIVESLEPQGTGALQLAFEQLKRKLAGEGLFEAARKRPLPKLPKRIGIVTSPSGAVISDILHVLARRFQGLHIRIFPAQVQGEGSVEQVCAGLRYFSGSQWPAVVILARGGGSLEDLWTFNEEAVARAIAASAIPVISAIGHETDFTIADFVADYRAPTPSAAAEIAICTSDSLLEQIAAYRGKALQALRYRLVIAARDLQQRGTDRAARGLHRRLTNAEQTVDDFETRLAQSWRKSIEHRDQHLAVLVRRLEACNLRLRFARIRHRSELIETRIVKSVETKLLQARGRHQSLTLHLSQLSPLEILARGYAIVSDSRGRIIRSSAEVAVGDPLRIRLGSGEIDVGVTKPHRDP